MQLPVKVSSFLRIDAIKMCILLIMREPPIHLKLHDAEILDYDYILFFGGPWATDG